MDNGCCISVHDGTQTAAARRSAAELASSLEFDEVEAGNVGLVVTEAVRNLLKHAGGGDLILRGWKQNGFAVVEMLAIDKGPGIPDIARSFADGYSTTGTPGTGLGAISRLASLHDIYSLPQQGTALLAQISHRAQRAVDPVKPLERFRIGAVSVAHPGEPVCGDAWSFGQDCRDRARVMVADGLGHGLMAADAARAASRVAEDHPAEGGAALIERVHAALRPTRGAAVAAAEVDASHGVLRYSGIGNISASIVAPGGTVRHLVSHPGTAGHEVHKIAEFCYRWEPESTLIMHSDGLATHWSLDRYPGLAARHPSLIAGVLYRDFTRGRDDATVVVLQENPALQEKALEETRA